MNRKHRLLLLAASAAIAATQAQAQFAAQQGDLLLSFRSDAPNDVTVNLGSFSIYENQGADALPITQFTAENLTSVFGSLNNLFYSVAGGSGNVGVPTGVPASTLWMSRARTDLNTQSPAWQRNTGSTQRTTAAKINEVGSYAVASGTDFSNTATQYADTGSTAYTQNMLANATGAANWDGTFGGSPEGFTGAFATANRLDLYTLAPGTGNGTYQGYFEFLPNGAMSFYSEQFVPVPEPSSLALLAGAGVIAVTLRRRTFRNA